MQLLPLWDTVLPKSTCSRKQQSMYPLIPSPPPFFYCISPADESKAEIYIFFFLNQANQLINSSHKILKFHI